MGRLIAGVGFLVGLRVVVVALLAAVVDGSFSFCVVVVVVVRNGVELIGRVG